MFPTFGQRLPMLAECGHLHIGARSKQLSMSTKIRRCWPPIGGRCVGACLGARRPRPRANPMRGGDREEKPHRQKTREREGEGAGEQEENEKQQRKARQSLVQDEPTSAEIRPANTCPKWGRSPTTTCTCVFELGERRRAELSRAYFGPPLSPKCGRIRANFGQLGQSWSLRPSSRQPQN